MTARTRRRHEERMNKFRAARDRIAAARAAPPPLEPDTLALFDMTDFDPDTKETP